MRGQEPPAYGTPEQQPPVPPTGAPKVFEARHEPREAVALVVVGGIGVAVVGTGVVLLAGLAPAGDLLDGGPFPAEPGAFRIVRLVMLVLFAAFGSVLAGAVVLGLARALRRALLLRIDADGVMLERRRWWRRERFVPWSAVRGLSLYSATRRDGDGTSTTHWFQVDLADGTIERRHLDRHRYSWAALAESVRAVAPQTALTVEGELPFRGGS